MGKYDSESRSEKTLFSVKYIEPLKSEANTQRQTLLQLKIDNYFFYNHDDVHGCFAGKKGRKKGRVEKDEKSTKERGENRE